MARTMNDLRQMQALPLDLKVSLTKARIRQWIQEYGEDGVYISFSGGKDSTVLCDIVDRMLPDNNIPRVFVNTGLEYPEIVKFAKSKRNVTILRPQMTFRKVIEKYGYPMFGKETAEVVYNAKKYLTKLAETAKISTDRQTDRQTDSCSCRISTVTTDYSDKASMLNPSRGGQTQSTENSVDLVSLAKSKDKWDMPYRVSLVLGTFETHWQKKKAGVLPKDGAPSRAKYSQKKYQFMLNAPFNISHMCCSVMKKEPLHRYAKETGRNAITAEMASESRLRTQKWLQNGCNGFNLGNPKSTPMAFWTENDVLQYIKENDIEICSVYGEVVADEEKSKHVEGQMRLNEDGLVFVEPCVYKTTGCKRTGCMFCGFGCQLEKTGEGRFARLKETHPKIYDYIMRPTREVEDAKGKKRKVYGLNYKEVIDWINEHGNMHIEY